MNKKSDVLVLYDGLCNVCVRSVAFIQRYDSARRFRYISIQSDEGRLLYKKEGLDPDNIQTFVLIKNKTAYSKSGAAIEALNALGGFWKVFNLFRIVPEFLRDAAYMYFARNRYRWFGRRE